MLESMVCQLLLIYPYFNVQFFGYLTIFGQTIFNFSSSKTLKNGSSALRSSMICRYCSLFFAHLDRAKSDNGTVLSSICMSLVNAYTYEDIYDNMRKHIKKHKAIHDLLSLGKSSRIHDPYSGLLRSK